MKQESDRLFVGKKKVIWYNTHDGLVDFQLDDGSSDQVTEDQFKAVAKPNRYDDGMVRVYKWNNAVSKIMEILLENRMSLIEKDFVTGRIDSTIIDAYQRAAAKLFGAKFEEFINLSDIDRVLKENNMKFNEDVAAEVGSDAEVVAEAVVSEEVEESAPEEAVSEEVAE